MLTRRQTLRTLGAAGIAAPVLSACGGGHAAVDAPAASGLRLVKADVSRSAGMPAAIPDVVASMTAFTHDLWPHLAGPADNLAVSPYSIAVALAMTANGGVGATRAQILNALQIDSLSTFNAGIAALSQAVEGLAGPVSNVFDKPGEVALATANSLFGDRAETWVPAFLTLLAKQYGAGMRAVDFRNAPERARTAINAWTAGQTHDRIPELLPVGSISALTRLVLVDALYFKAPWYQPFRADATTRAPFHRASGSSVEVEMMHAGDGAMYVSGDHYRGARLPYAGRRVAMTLALPEGDEQLALTELLGDLRGPAPDPVVLSVPRWTFRVASDLKKPLQALGMTTAFTDGADFSGMTTDEPLLVSDVYHQTFVAVDEHGTEAAAATAVVMDALSGVANPHTVVLDRPFLFVIHDTAHGTPLFVGRVADPS